VLGEAGPSESFGHSAGAADFDGDGLDDLVVGAFEDVNDVGALNILYGASGSGLTVLGDQFWYQDSVGVLETAESGDRFGSPFPGSRFLDFD
jgi:hypothetical protein